MESRWLSDSSFGLSGMQQKCLEDEVRRAENFVQII